VAFEQAFEDCDRSDEVLAEQHQQVDVVEVFVAVKAMSEVVARVDSGLQFATVWAHEEESAVSHFRGRAITTEGGDRDGHRQIVANPTNSVFLNHAFSQD
jgi:hypothetical protein